MKAEWEYESLEKIKRAFEDPQIKLISFDVFDTLVFRPLEQEADAFELLDKYFGEMTSAQVSFRKLRVEAESVLRRHIIRKDILREDIHLDDIYEVLEKEFGLAADVVSVMKQKEFELQLKLCVKRQSGAELFEWAVAIGKPVIIISDMYLSKDQIAHILDKNGYWGIKSLYVSSDMGFRKITGNLYIEVAKCEGVQPSEIFHVGDNLESDCRMADRQGFRTAWLPKAMDVYESYGCAHQVEKICGDLTNWEMAKNEVGIGIMRAMAAMKYFDNPFRDFVYESDYNADPYFVGYAALGMEVFALVRWLADQVSRDGVREMIFLARDGYLPMKVYEMYRKSHRELPEASYLHVSRLSVFPAMIRTPEDLYDLPVDIAYQTPRKLFRLLDFCVGKQQEISGFEMDEVFTKDTFQKFIRYFIQNVYDREKHERATAHIAEYLTRCNVKLSEHAALFDMGYSGRILSAIINASGIRPYVYYFHTDSREHFRYEKRSGMKIRSFLDFNPYMESSLREYAYLEPAASCIGYSEGLEPLYDIGPAEGYIEPVTAMQQGAEDFVRDYLNFFEEFEHEAEFRNHDASMPFEAFLRYCVPYDRKIYENVLIDDELWGGRRDINLRYLMEARLRKIPDYAKEKIDG